MSDQQLEVPQQDWAAAVGHWSATKTETGPATTLTVVGLFAGIGGFEEGFRRAGHYPSLLCESDPAARRVLIDRFPDVDCADDIRDLARLPECDVVTAGFPCQDLSQVGRTKGIFGADSGLIKEVFRLIEQPPTRLKWLLLENVPFMLRLHKGRAIREITEVLSSMGWKWAYRTVDTQAFGLPQRRHRVLLLASRSEDPRPVLLNDDAAYKASTRRRDSACGFYWTEGHRGLGWAVNATPPLKGGSGLAIPSPPAIWLPKRRAILVPSIEDAERLQGFQPGWTAAAGSDARGGRCRWRLVGNAISVPVASWIASRLCAPAKYDPEEDIPLGASEPWPQSAWSFDGEIARSNASPSPVSIAGKSLSSFIARPSKPLSLNASAGFLCRLEHSCLRVDEAFMKDLRRHVEKAKRDKKEQSTDPAVSRRMAVTRGRDNPRELALRSALQKEGLRFRVHRKLLKGLQRTADIALPSLRIAIFLDGCFWHGCPKHGTWPKTNAKWWRAKILANRKRDRDTDRRLKANGWTVVRIWEHEDAQVVVKRIMHMLKARAGRLKHSAKKR